VVVTLAESVQSATPRSFITEYLIGADAASLYTST
jgi:hypothetical protein